MPQSSVDDGLDWLAGMRTSDPATLVRPGLTVGEFLDYHRRPSNPKGSEFEGSVTYGHADRPLTLELYRRSDPTEKRPGVVFLHGGGWQEYGPSMHTRYLSALAAEGYVTASVGYRLAPEAPWPACLEDAKCAVRWARAHASHLGLDPDRIAVAGNSAGGHLAAMVALTPGSFDRSGGWAGVPSTVQASFLLYPVVDLTEAGAPALVEATRVLFGPDSSEATRIEASPVAQVHPGSPPMASMVGTDDSITPVGPISGFHRLLTEAGVTNALTVLPTRGHAFDWFPDDWPLAFDALREFLATHL